MAGYNNDTQRLPQHAFNRKLRARAVGWGWCIVLGVLLGCGGHRYLAARVPAFALMTLDAPTVFDAPTRHVTPDGVPAPDAIFNPTSGEAATEDVPYATGGENGSLLLGNPLGASRASDNYLLEKPQYSLAYNCHNGAPNWVAWHLCAADIGHEGRGRTPPAPDYAADPVLRADWQISPFDYAAASSRYDRGHLCPSADRSDTRQNNDATFAMTNIAPQTAALNRGVWASLEKQCRAWARAGQELYIVAGSVGSQDRIAGGRVNVPQAYWKVILILPQGTDDLARITATTPVVSVLIPNEQRVLGGWESYVTSVAQLEARTNYSFFSALPSEVRAALKQQAGSGSEVSASTPSPLSSADETE